MEVTTFLLAIANGSCLAPIEDGVVMDTSVLTFSVFSTQINPLALIDADGDTSTDEFVTQALQEEDLLAVRRGNRSYLVRIDVINFEDGSNDDSYTVSIQW